MTTRKNDIHKNLVEHWQNKNASGLSSEKLTQLYEKAIHAIKERSLVTLSKVTMLVVLDRALHESKENFPILAEIKLDTDNIDFQSVIRENGHHKPEVVREALKFLLIEILNVLGNITADILTAPLHTELMKITSEASPDSVNQPTLANHSRKTKREES